MATESSLAGAARSGSLVRAGVCALLAFAVYAFTLCPNVTNRGDTGELAAASHMLGIAHPSGYPLFMMLGKIFEQVPLGALAMRFNLISAAFGAATIGVVFLLAERLTSHNAASRLAALTFGFCPSFWSQAEFAEVYTLNAFFFAMALFAGVSWRHTGDARWLAGGALTIGLGLANHMTLALLLPALVVLLAGGAPSRSPRLARRFGLAIGFGLLGLLLNAYLPIRAARHPLLDGGYLSQGLGLRGMFLGKSYVAELIKSGQRELTEGAQILGALTALNLHLLLPLALLGMGVLMFRDRLLALALLLAAVPLPLFFICYGQPGVQYFLIPTFLILAVLGGVGWSSLSQRLRQIPVRCGIPAAIVVAQFLIALPICDARGDRISARYAESILDEVEHNATILINDDLIAFPLYYYCYAEERRPDVKLVFDHEAAVWRQTARENWSRGPVYTVFWYDEMGDEYTLAPAGPLMRVLRKDDLPQAEPSRFQKLPEARANWRYGDLRRLQLQEVNLAPRHLVTVDMVWEWSRSADPADWEIWVLGRRVGHSGSKSEDMTMRVRGRWYRFGERQRPAYCYRDYGKLEGLEFAHSMTLQIAEEALPGRYDLLVALTKKGATEESALRVAKKVGTFTVWSIRGATVF